MVKANLIEHDEQKTDLAKVSLEDLLLNVFPNVYQSEDKTKLVIETDIDKLVFELQNVQSSCHGFGLELSNSLTKEEIRMAIYHYALSICENGTKAILKRDVDEIFVNNYNPHWMEAWNGNMDLQLCLDYFSIITYMTDYVTKPEKKTTEILKSVQKQKQRENAPHRDLMYSLAQTYLTHREMGECEAYYKLDPDLHYKQSNIRTVFVTSGFPWNRSNFLRKCKPNDSDRGFDVDEYDGKFMETETIHDKYSMRPATIEMMCLAQFAMWYTLLSHKEMQEIKKKFGDNIPMSAEPITVCSDTLGQPPSDNLNLTLPEYIVLGNGKMMRKRGFAAVLRRHKFKYDIDPHEFCYSEMLLFRPWRNENDLFSNMIDDCLNLYDECDRNAEIVNEIPLNKTETVKRGLFPHLIDVEEGREMVEKFEYDSKEKVGNTLDGEGEQDFDDGEDFGPEEAESYLGLHPDDFEEPANRGSNESTFNAPPLINMEVLLESTRQLVDEQMVTLNMIVEFCRTIVKAKRNPSLIQVIPPRMVVHGGAGTGKSTLIRVISQWVQIILQAPGDDINCPYLIRAAPTGMAAANIEGLTLHSAFKLNFGNSYISLSDKNRDLFRNIYNNLQIVIIDEFSMMKSDQLYQIHQRLCEIKENDEPFGKCSVILFGDLMQLKPVRGAYIFEKPKFEKYSQVFDVFNLWEMFDSIELEQNHRQGDDMVYAEVLNRIRFKTKIESLSENDLEVLNSRVLSPENEDKVLKIFGKNFSVNLENYRRLGKLAGQLYVIDAIHLPKERNVKIKEGGTIEDTAFLDKLELKVGARVMLIHNVCTADGLTNGAQGVVMKVLLSERKVRYIMVKFDKKEIGAQQRHKLRFLSTVCNIEGVTPIERINFSYTLGNVSKNHAARASFLQIPLKLSWAVTSHKVNINLCSTSSI